MTLISENNFMNLNIADDIDNIPAIERGANSINLIKTNNRYLRASDLVDNLTTDDSTKVLTAKQGKIIKDILDGLPEFETEGDGNTFLSNDGTYKSGVDLNEYKMNEISDTWEIKTWGGLSFYGSYIWTYNNTTYLSDGNNQYYLDGNEWKVKTWTGLTNFNGNLIWEHNGVTYYSHGSIQYYLDGNEWKVKTWTGLTNFNGNCIWKYDDITYYSEYYTGTNLQYYLDGDEWKVKTWTDYNNINGRYIWKYEGIYYYSDGSVQRYLDGNEWKVKTWTSYTNIDGRLIWEYAGKVYFSNGSIQRYLDGNEWKVKTWTGLTNFYGENVWIYKGVVYYSSLTNHYKMINKVLTSNDFTNTDKNKIDSIVVDGDGDKFKSDDGTYKAISGGGSISLDEYDEIGLVDSSEFSTIIVVDKEENIPEASDGTITFIEELDDPFTVKSEVILKEDNTIGSEILDNIVDVLVINNADEVKKVPVQTIMQEPEYITIANNGNVTQSINSNTFYDFTSTALTKLKVNKGTERSNVYNEFMFQFIAGNTAPELETFATVWVDAGIDPYDLEPDKIYQVSILNGIGVIIGVDNV